MKIMQIRENLCYWDATAQFPSLNDTYGKFSDEILFVEAPDFVFEGWGYIDGNFIKPTPPDGWVYDETTGTFYQEGFPPAPSEAEQIRADVDYLAVMTGVEL